MTSSDGLRRLVSPVGKVIPGGRGEVCGFRDRMIPKPAMAKETATNAKILIWRGGKHRSRTDCIMDCSECLSETRNDRPSLSKIGKSMPGLHVSSPIRQFPLDFGPQSGFHTGRKGPSIS